MARLATHAVTILRLVMKTKILAGWLDWSVSSARSQALLCPITILIATQERIALANRKNRALAIPANRGIVMSAVALASKLVRRMEFGRLFVSRLIPIVLLIWGNQLRRFPSLLGRL